MDSLFSVSLIEADKEHPSSWIQERIQLPKIYPFRNTRWTSKLFSNGYFQHRKVFNHNLKICCLLICDPVESVIKLHAEHVLSPSRFLKKLA
jgi:hypothetical protein